jgi:L-ascorbate metabolism protein UlaG (beta-lactamase superfamily)
VKIIKYVHSCLVVETPGRVAIFDPGAMSAEALGAAIPAMARLDDIFITHVHADHCDPALIKKLLEKFPAARITGPAETVGALAEENIKASDQVPEGVVLFESPHENVAPLFGEPPQEYGYHYLGQLSDPGDSHSFKETKSILAMPVQAPWGSAIRAMNLALELKPKHVLPIHDWHWSDAAREQMYGRFEQVLGEQGITFHKLQTGQPVEIEP